LKPHAGSLFSTYATLVKFIPISAIIIFGFVGAGINHGNGNFFGHTDVSGNNVANNFMPLAMFSSLPAILFSFDGFSTAGSITSRINEPEKNLPKVMLFALLVTGTIYIAIALAQVLAGVSSAFELFDVIFKNNPTANRAFTILINCFI
jgi:amino acid transporter